MPHGRAARRAGTRSARRGAGECGIVPSRRRELRRSRSRRRLRSSRFLSIRFEDGARHYRNANGITEYPRYLPEQYVAIAENILLYQRDNGGWRENWDPARILDETEKRAVLADKSKTDTSLDNRTTYTHLEYLAEVFERTRDERFRTACLRGLEFLLGAQHPAGGFPHSFPDTSGYRGNITLMDDVTPGALKTLRKAALGRAPFAFLDAPYRERARRSVELGDACLLKLQVRVKGLLTVWAGQYDPRTLEPTSARAFELPSLVSDESASVVRYLMAIESPSPEVVASVEAAIRWFERAKIKGMRVETVPAEPVRYKHHTSKDDRVVVRDAKAPPMWARFYEIGTNRPFMANRDGKKVYKLSEVERERQNRVPLVRVLRAGPSRTGLSRVAGAKRSRFSARLERIS